ncbi:MAG: glycine cleavage system protein T [Acidimicrobiales bacterium]|nr:glycine cleavage system protein T [Acidimicrobiales bacterium]
MPEVFPHTNLRRSPYYEATIADGVTLVHPYNRMLLPLGYGDPEAEYRRLVEGVSMWDVAAERQVQLKGPDAAQLAQILCTRDLTSCVAGQGKYVAVCNHAGTIINDPIVLKIDDDCFWFSIADSDLRLWANCVAGERGLNVEISEPDVSPLAVQGPLADDVVAAIFGDWVRNLRHFWFRDAEIDGIPLRVARSGWSKQGGFELYLMDGSRGLDLWNIVKEAGKPWEIAAGYPNPSERIESGLLSWGGDVDEHTNPFEVRLGRFVDLDVPDDVIGIEALRTLATGGPRRHQLGVVLRGDEPRPGHNRWYDIEKNGIKVGDMTNGVWSFKLRRNIGFGLVSVECQTGDDVQVRKGDELIDARLTAIPFREEDR